MSYILLPHIILFLLEILLSLKIRREINYTNKSLCFGFTGIAKYIDRLGVCKLNCDLKTNYSFKSESNDECEKQYNYSYIKKNRLYISNESEITKYYYERDMWKKTYITVVLFYYIEK